MSDDAAPKRQKTQLVHQPTLSRRVATLSSKLNKIERLFETKTHDESLTPSATGYDAEAVTILCDPAQGATEDNRIGDSISPFRITIRGTLRQNASTDGRGAIVRIMLVQSKQRYIPLSATNSNAQGLLQQAGTVNAPLSQFNFQNRKHFTVLSDVTYAMSNEDTGGSTSNIAFVINKKLTKNISYSPDSVVAERGQLYLVRTSNAAVSAAPLLSFESRVFYKDA